MKDCVKLYKGVKKDGNQPVSLHFDDENGDTDRPIIIEQLKKVIKDIPIMDE